MHDVHKRVEKLADLFAEEGPRSDELGRLTDAHAALLRETGVVRMLQPAEYGGYEAHPVEFMETVLDIGRRSASAGWVAGVVGVHPWEMAQVDREVQEEVWGGDPDTWIASPYAPLGQARRVDGGWIVNGRWSFSSGTDHCDWLFLGGWLLGEDGEVDRSAGHRHFVLKRGEYEIVEGSWDVMGLKGTGSKDIVVRDAFLPGNRIVDPARMREGAAALGRDANPLYRLTLPVMFSGVICAGALAAAEGALAASVHHTRERVDARGNAAVKDPHHLAALGQASSDIQAGRLQFLNDLNALYDAVAAGHEPTPGMRLTARNNQVRAVRRAVDAVDLLFVHAGGGALRLDAPFQRFWRDLHAAMNHINNAAEPVHEGYALHTFGLPVPPALRY